MYPLKSYKQPLIIMSTIIVIKKGLNFVPTLCGAHTPVFVHNEVSGLRELRQVGQQRGQMVELCMLVETFSAEYVHQLRQTNLLLKNLEETKK